MLFLSKTPYFLFRLLQLINRRYLDEFHPFDPLCLFKDAKIHQDGRLNSIGGNNTSAPVVLAEITRLRQYIGGIIVFLNKQGGSNLQDDFHLELHIQKEN